MELWSYKARTFICILLVGPSKRSTRSTRQSMTSTKLPGTFLLLRPGVRGSLSPLSPLSRGVLPLCLDPCLDPRHLGLLQEGHLHLHVGEQTG